MPWSQIQQIDIFINQEKLLLLKLTFRCNSLVEHNILVTDLFSLLSVSLIFFSLIFDDISVATPVPT